MPARVSDVTDEFLLLGLAEDAEVAAGSTPSPDSDTSTSTETTGSTEETEDETEDDEDAWPIEMLIG